MQTITTVAALTFATFNGETLTLDNYIEGETQM